MNKYLKIVILIAALALIWYLFLVSNKNKPQPVSTNVNVQTKNVDKVINTSVAVLISEPINGAMTRVTKKPFGIEVSPTNSPVLPERFSGYHTGVDFETTVTEKTIDVNIMAICDGKLIYKNWVNGYGGVAIESCVIDKQKVTVIYGHLKLSSISLKTGSTIKSGEKFALLGTGFSTETNGERKHLHLGIHKGDKINFLGYVKNKNDLSGWLDATKYLQK